MIAGDTFGPGTGPILDDLECQGNETNINNCLHNNWQGTLCGHEKDVGVKCSKCTYVDMHCAIICQFYLSFASRFKSIYF